MVEFSGTKNITANEQVITKRTAWKRGPNTNIAVEHIYAKKAFRNHDTLVSGCTFNFVSGRFEDSSSNKMPSSEWKRIRRRAQLFGLILKL